MLVVPQGRSGASLQIHILWENVGNISGDRDGYENGKRSGTFKRKGFGYDIRKTQASPAIRDLLGSERFTEAVLAFLKDTRVGLIKEGILNKSWNVHRGSFFLPLFYIFFFFFSPLFLSSSFPSPFLLSPGLYYIFRHYCHYCVTGSRLCKGLFAAVIIYGIYRDSLGVSSKTEEKKIDYRL